jgi:hypothetical protein
MAVLAYDEWGAIVMAGIGYFALAVSIMWLALLSRRLGRATHAPPYYMGLFVSALIIAVVAIFRVMIELGGVNGSPILWAAIQGVLPVLSLTIGVGFAWQYWSWLFAERD